MIMMGYPKFLEVQYTFSCMYKYVELLVLSLASFQASSHIIPTSSHPKQLMIWPRSSSWLIQNLAVLGFSELKIRAVFKRRYFEKHQSSGKKNFLISMRFRVIQSCFPLFFLTSERKTLCNIHRCQIGSCDFINFWQLERNSQHRFFKRKNRSFQQSIFLRFSKIFRNQFKTSSKRSMARRLDTSAKNPKTIVFFYEMLPR